MKWILGWGLVCMMLSAPSHAYDRLSDTGYFQYMAEYELSAPYDTTWFRKLTHFKRGLFLTYSPQYPLWSDGAEKRRWIYLPKRSRINTEDPDNWQFPVGAKIWKEFSFIERGRRIKIETRLLEKQQDGNWLMETYLWDDAQIDANRAPEEGVTDYYALPNNRYYSIPSHHDCQYCHSKAGLERGPRKTPVLGFSALQLSDNRDPDAMHGEPLNNRMVLLPDLEKLRLTTHRMATVPAIPDSEQSPLQRSVFGYLYGNCAHCHNPAGMSEFTTTLSFHHPAQAEFIQENDTYRTALSKSITAYLNPGSSPQQVIDPGNAGGSALLYRMTNETDRYRFTVPGWHHSAGFSVEVGVKMPFTGTNVIDEEAVSRIRQYINDLEPH